MEPWHWTALILCGFGLLKELRPSEPFVTEYIVDYKNISADTLIHVLFPISTYTILGTLVAVFLLTDFLRYKPVVVFQALCYVATWVTLIYGTDLLAMKFVQILYGFAISADVAYYTYIYAQVSKDNYKKVTSYTYTATFLGKFLAGTLAQILVSTRLLNYHELNYVTLGSLSTALLLALALPKVRKSIYFNRLESQLHAAAAVNYDCDNNIKPINGSNNGISKDKQTRLGTEESRIKKAYPVLWKDFKSAYRNSYVLKWSLWWAMAMAGNLQIQNYIQALWKVVDSTTGSRKYNGAVNAIQCLLCALLSFAVGHVHVEWRKWGEIVLGLMSLCQGALLIHMSQTESLLSAYATYITFRVLYQVMITIANSEVAQGISTDSCGLIFGLNTFLALSLQTVLTLIVSDEHGLALDERTQFLVYAGFFGVLGMAFSMVAITTFCKHGCGNRKTTTGLNSRNDDSGEFKEIQKLNVIPDSEDPATIEWNGT